MVRLRVALSASSQRCVQDLVEGLRFLMSGTRLEPGCRECSLWVDPDSMVHYVEEWETEADMRQRVPLVPLHVAAWRHRISKRASTGAIRFRHEHAGGSTTSPRSGATSRVD